MRRAISVGTSVSVARGPCGPCCSVEPVRMTTVWWSTRNASTSRFVISPRNTVGGFIGDPPVASSGGSGDGRRQLADPLDPARDDVAGPEVVVGADRALEPRRRAGRDQVAGAQRDVAAQ